MYPVIVTHDGKHHADEAFAVWAMLMLWPESRVVRTADRRLWDHADILLDCGGVYDPASGRFDHHSRNLRHRLYGTHAPLATAGLVWESYGQQVIREVLKIHSNVWSEFVRKSPPAHVDHCVKFFAERVDNEIVAPIDAWDNGVFPPRQLAKSVLPFQWMAPHFEFHTLVEALGKAVICRVCNLAETVVAELQLSESVTSNGPHAVYACGEWGIVRAAPGCRLSVVASKLFCENEVDLKLMAVLSQIRNGTRWGAFFAEPVPDRIRIPRDMEYTASRLSVFHDNPDKLHAFVRRCCRKLSDCKAAAGV